MFLKNFLIHCVAVIIGTLKAYFNLPNQTFSLSDSKGEGLQRPEPTFGIDIVEGL